MASTIKLKNGSGAPTAGDLVQGEPALDLTNKRLYTEDSGGTVLEIGTNPTSITTGTFTSTGIDDNATSTAITIDSNENVGIGTSSPDTLLNIASESAPTLRIENTDTSLTTNQTIGDIDFYQTDPSGTGAGVVSKIRSINSSSFQGEAGLAFHTGTTGGLTERMRIDSSGNVGIGTSSPGDKLHVEGNIYLGASSRTVYTGGSANLVFQTNTGSHLFLRNNGASEAMRIDSAGRVGIGTSSPATPLQVRTGTNENLAVQTKSGAIGITAFNDAVSSNVNLHLQGTQLIFDGAGSAERMRIDSSGNLLVGTTSWTTGGGGLRVTPSGRSDFSRNTTSSTQAINFANPNGFVGNITLAGSATAYNTSSDYRLKEDVKPMADAVDRVLALKPCNFAWKVDGSRVDGFIAHEAQEVVPEAVHGTKDAMRTEEYEVSPAVYEDVTVAAVLDDEGNELEPERTEQKLVTEAVMGEREVPDYQGIDQSKLVPLLTAALQEALTEIQSLKDRVAALEA